MSGDFLSRWSRRKAEAAAPSPPSDAGPEPQSIEALGQEASPPPEALVGEEAEAPVELSAEEIAALPPVEELTPGSDLAPFLRAGVPTLLRNAALRRMWAIDPAIRDFLNDAREYAYDWNTPGGVPGLGPLLPSDDVREMVRCVFDGQARRANARQDTAAGVEEPDVTGPSDGADRPPEPLQEAPQSLGHAPARLDEAASAAAVPDGRLATIEARPAEARDAAGEPAPGRFRRHGGATPA
ncbi:DUF3306 domain-containing protein [Hansschlegelia beijingensis]|uniref:DUF3306 domain-containing protein n=1 Tax=Hansschlegelia beijingensis TaxID=1133344 RepID=A0A7W6D4A2_9HYPH|nr:DUF3306 domain-containing protein [Hansschlegelia beijingensis]MBB3974040.1 hypothetical protein [Hansschlegelia beijingensis]